MKYYTILHKSMRSLGIPKIMIASETYLDDSKKIETPSLMEFWITNPAPRKLFMPDLISTPNLVISIHLYEILSPLDLPNVQLLPARIYKLPEEFYDHYWGVHIYNKINCIDLKLSDVDVQKDLGITDIRKLVLDRKRLEKIPQEERLLFRMEENSVFQLFHESLVEKIMAINPTGVNFIDIEDYHSDILFQKDSQE